jgi:hypothetical protein
MRVQGDTQVSYSSIFYVDTALIFLYDCGYPIGVYLLKRNVNPAIILGIGGFLSIAGVLMASFSTDMVSFILWYGCLNAVGCGIQYMVPLVIVWEYYPE